MGARGPRPSGTGPWPPTSRTGLASAASLKPEHQGQRPRRWQGAAKRNGLGAARDGLPGKVPPRPPTLSRTGAKANPEHAKPNPEQDKLPYDRPPCWGFPPPRLSGHPYSQPPAPRLPPPAAAAPCCCSLLLPLPAATPGALLLAAAPCCYARGQALRERVGSVARSRGSFHFPRNLANLGTSTPGALLPVVAPQIECVGGFQKRDRPRFQKHSLLSPPSLLLPPPFSAA